MSGKRVQGFVLKDQLDADGCGMAGEGYGTRNWREEATGRRMARSDDGKGEWRKSDVGRGKVGKRYREGE